MDAWNEFGVQFSMLLQTAGWLEEPMRFLTFLGKQEFFIFVLPAVYWCIDAALGVRIGFILLVGNALNECAKMALQGPRPCWVSTRVAALAAESSFGIPSGHAQAAVGVWGMMAARIGRSWAWIAAAIVVLLIGLSRIYLAVHFPHDVVFGWLLGGLTLWAFLASWNRLARFVGRLTFPQQLVLSLVLPTLILLAGWKLVADLSGYSLPAEWMIGAMRAGEPYPAPVSMNGLVTAAGTLLGLSWGFAVIHRLGDHQPSGPVWMRLLCFVLGLLGVLVLYLGSGAVFPEGASFLASSLRLARFGLLGVWVAAGAPMVFRGLGLVPGRPR